MLYLSLSDATVSGTVFSGVEPVDWGPAVAARVSEGLAGVCLPDVGPPLEAEPAGSKQERLEVTHRLDSSQTTSTTSTSSKDNSIYDMSTAWVYILPKNYYLQVHNRLLR